jgi:hypothetical protein
VNSFTFTDKPVVGAFSRVPCINRGYQANGAETVRPSAKSTTKASSVNRAAMALLVALSITEVFMPFFSEVTEIHIIL